MCVLVNARFTFDRQPLASQEVDFVVLIQIIKLRTFDPRGHSGFESRREDMCKIMSVIFIIITICDTFSKLSYYVAHYDSRRSCSTLVN